MARLTDRQRLARAVDFLAGLSKPEVKRTLAQRGLTSQELEDGFGRLRAAIETFHGGERDVTPPDVLGLLDEWENRWLPIVSATLKRRFPTVAESVLLNISQQSGLALFTTLPTLLDRLEALEHSKRALDHQARELLIQRGVSHAVLVEARTLLSSARSLPARSSIAAGSSGRDQLEALWAWYLEWSRITRASIADPALLRLLGFGKVGRPRGSAK